MEGNKFGWKKAPSFYQHTVRRILLKYKIKFVWDYFQNILPYSYEEHLNHLQEISIICREE